MAELRQGPPELLDRAWLQCPAVDTRAPAHTPASDPSGFMCCHRRSYRWMPAPILCDGADSSGAIGHPSSR